MSARVLLGLVVVLPGLLAQPAAAQTRKPTAQEVAAIRNCATKYRDDVDEGERQCVFNLVATPCTNTREGSCNIGMADCYRVEWVVWDNLLNENFKNLMGALDSQQTGSPTATRPAIFTWTRFRARWRFRWERLVRRAKQRTGRCSFGSSIKSRRAECGSTVQPSRRSYSSTAFSRSCAPAAHCSKLVHSASLWEIPPRLGTKIMVVGATRAT